MWIPAHTGNKMADTFAKEATKKTEISLTMYLWCVFTVVIHAVVQTVAVVHTKAEKTKEEAEEHCAACGRSTYRELVQICEEQNLSTLTVSTSPGTERICPPLSGVGILLYFISISFTLKKPQAGVR